MKWIWMGKSKITRLKGATKSYATIRLSDDPNLTGKTAQIYKGFIKGYEAYLILISEECIDPKELSLNESLNDAGDSLNSTDIEKQISSIIERKLSEITKRLNKLNTLQSDFIDCGAGGGIRTHEPLREWILSPPPSNQELTTTKYKNSIINYDKYKSDFKDWIRNRVTEKHAKTTLSYMDKYCDRFSDEEDIEEILEKSTSRKWMTIALRNFINFLEEKEIIDSERANKLRKPLKVVRSRADAYIPSDNEIFDAYQRFDEDRYKIVFKVLMYSGIRVTEAVELLTNFDERKLMVEDKIAKYPLFAERASKKAYYVYMPAEFAKELRKLEITERGVEKYFTRRGLPAKYLRKWNYNFLILNGVPESVADFIQGRASITVGSMHYLAKVKQADEWYSRVVHLFPIL